MQKCPESSDFECFKTRYELFFFFYDVLYDILREDW